MKRAEPPSLATWVLEHLTPADRDEAVAGDLLEVYRSGRSNAWYWRQVLAACTVAWVRRAGDRKPLLVFAALWAMLAPAWIALEERLESGLHTSQPMWLHIDGPSSILVGLLLNSSFLWLGILLYLAAHGNFTRTFSRKQIARTFIAAPVVFFLAYFLTFVLMDVFYFHGPGGDRHIQGPLRELADLSIWADALRIPYFATLLCALWGIVPRSGRPASQLTANEELVAQSVADSDVITIAFKDPEEWSANRFIGMMIGAGLLNAFIVSLLFCRLPASHAPTEATLFMRAVIYVAITAVAGIAGTRFYWNEPSGSLASDVPVSFWQFALIGASAWVWLPAAMLFSPQDSPASPIIVAATAAILASGLREAIPAQTVPDVCEHELFADALRTPSRSADGGIISVCIFLALIAIADHQALNAGAPLAVCSWLIAWRLTRVPGDLSCVRKQIPGAFRRLGWMSSAAIFATFVALLFGVEHRNLLAAKKTSNDGESTSASRDRAAKQSHQTGIGAPGYESIILWPQPEKEQIVPPLPAHFDLLPQEAKRPLVLSFTGSYWYFQPPNSAPGLRAHLAHGTPLGLNIRSSNALPLTMEAHQRLAGSIRLARCREIQITLANRDNHAGALAMAVLLTDSAHHGQPALYLGQQPVVRNSSERFAGNDSPWEEVLRFAVPEQARIRKFDAITVMFLTDPLHQLTAPQIAIEQFEIIPR